MRGQVFRIRLFDLGGTMDLAALQSTLARRGTKATPRIGKGTPGYVEFPRPLSLELAPMRLRSPLGETMATVLVSYYAIGAASFQVRVPFEAPRIEALGAFSQLSCELDGRWMALDDALRQLLDRERPLWEPAIRDFYTRDVLDESYTVYACEHVGQPADQFFQGRQRQIAALLKGEAADRLHDKEVKEATRTWFSYYSDDVIVVDWDSAFVIDPSPEYEDLLFVLEIANLQLLEFRAYDKYLDGVLARAYDELERVHKRPIVSSARRTAHELSLARMEIAELADEADNITKFLGDWFLARVYEGAQQRFHLPQWRASVDDKLATLHQLYQVAIAESDSRRMVVLEILIVLLFVLDVLILFFL